MQSAIHAERVRIATEELNAAKRSDWFMSWEESLGAVFDCDAPQWEASVSAIPDADDGDPGMTLRAPEEWLSVRLPVRCPNTGKGIAFACFSVRFFPRSPFRYRSGGHSGTDLGMVSTEITKCYESKNRRKRAA